MASIEAEFLPFEESEQQNAYTREESLLVKKLMQGKNPLVRSLQFSTYHFRNYVMPRYVAYAEYRTIGGELEIAAGTGVSIEEASVKALAEAYERHVSGRIRVDRTRTGGTAPRSVYDISEVAPQHESFLGENRPITQPSYVTGARLADKRAMYAPIDQVFYPVRVEEGGASSGYRASSSGVAAHTSKKSAIDAAVLELIERDAVAVTWYGRRTPPRIPHSYATIEMRIRMRDFETLTKRQIIFCNLTLDSVPVVMCILKGKTYPFQTVGSAAHWSFQGAMRKALDEAELMFHSTRGTAQRKTAVREKDVRTVEDHALYWSRAEQSASLDWLLAGKELPPVLAPVSWQSLVDAFDPAIIVLARPPQDPLHVVRAVSQRLMSLTFGYGAEHFRHPRVKLLGFEWAWPYPAQPHILA